MIMNFNELKNFDFALSEINAIFQKPLYRIMNVKSRRNNGLLYITRGECKYTFNGGDLTLSEGSIAYLPISSAYTLTVTSEFFENYRTNFMLTIKGENVRFSDVPIKLTDSATPECIEAMRALEESFRLENSSISKTEKLCTVFSLLQNFSGSPKSLKLAPAVRYIHEHLHESFSIKTLSSLCFLSTTRFYALFKKEFGKTPLEYKNKLLLDRAIMLFNSYGISIAETSSMLGFENPAYFSRFFKKHMGISPKEFIKKFQ